MTAHVSGAPTPVKVNGEHMRIRKEIRKTRMLFSSVLTSWSSDQNQASHAGQVFRGEAVKVSNYVYPKTICRAKFPNSHCLEGLKFYK